MLKWESRADQSEREVERKGEGELRCVCACVVVVGCGGIFTREVKIDRYMHSISEVGKTLHNKFRHCVSRSQRGD